MNYSCIDISKVDRKYKCGSFIQVKAFENEYKLQLSEQRTGFGSRKFFVCPVCGKRKMRLYCSGNLNFTCANCAGLNLYKPIQNGTKGGYIEIQYRMERYAAAHSISFEWPFDYQRFEDDKRMKKDKFIQALTVLQVLENMRMQNILFNTTYRTRTIQAVLSGKHPIFCERSLSELKKWYWKI